MGDQDETKQDEQPTGEAVSDQADGASSEPETATEKTEEVTE